LHINSGGQGTNGIKHPPEPLAPRHASGARLVRIAVALRHSRHQKERSPVKSHRITPLNNVTIPLAVERHVQAIRITQIQEDCNHILESDKFFPKTYRQLRDSYTSGVIKAHEFRNIIHWQVSSALRRAGLPLNVARCYQHMSNAATNGL
jgi:hypothetical protein